MWENAHQSPSHRMEHCWKNRIHYEINRSDQQIQILGGENSDHNLQRLLMTGLKPAMLHRLQFPPSFSSNAPCTPLYPSTCLLAGPQPHSTHLEQNHGFLSMLSFSSSISVHLLLISARQLLKSYLL